MNKYHKPEIRTYTSGEILEVLGPAQAQSGTVTIYGGGSAMLDTGQKAEYRFAKTDLDYGIIKIEEVKHA